MVFIASGGSGPVPGPQGVGTHGPFLSPDQIAQYAYGAGFRGSGLVTAIAVALAESSGGVNSYSAGTSSGLWQIKQSAHPQWAGSAIFNPAVNAEATYALSNHGTYWGIWGTFVSGAYITHMQQAMVAAAAVSSTPPAPSAPGGLNWFQQALGDWQALYQPGQAASAAAGGAGSVASGAASAAANAANSAATFAANAAATAAESALGIPKGTIILQVIIGGIIALIGLILVIKDTFPGVIPHLPAAVPIPV